MMIEWLGIRNDDDEATQVSKLIEQAISEHLKEGSIMTYDLGGSASTSEVGTNVVKHLSALFE
jgi:isocitrate/isopropylmalate dehydrogenase